MEKEQIVKAANEIRRMLLDEFPENPTLDKQCKRATILLDMYFKRKKVKSYPTAGFITKNEDKNDHDRGHVWNIVTIEKIPYLLDVTLTQFQSYLDLKVPEILFMPYEEAREKYSYQPDGKGKYKYRNDDVRFSLVMKVNKIE